MLVRRTQPLSPAARRRNVTAAIEALEGRVLMAAQPLSVSEVSVAGGTQLRVTGTAAAEQVTVVQSASGLVLTSGGWSETYRKNYVSLLIDGGAGNDVISLDPSVTVDAVLKGGAGNDSLTGGSGNDRIYGGLGSNLLNGGAGDDILVSVGGATTDRLTGGAGRDSFWLDSAASEVVTDASAAETGGGTIHRIGDFANAKTTQTVTTSVKTTAKVKGKRVSSIRTVTTTRVVSAGKDLVGQNLIDPSITRDASGYQNYADHVLFPAGGPGPDDVKQGQVGDCYYLSVLSSVAKANPDALKQAIVDLGDGTFAVRFRKGANTVYVRVDADLPTANGGVLAYADFGAQGSLWASLMEKAWASFRTSTASYASIDSGWMDESCKALGIAASSTMSGSGQQILSLMAVALAAGKSVTFAVGTPPAGCNLIGSHAYSIDRVDFGPDGKPVTLRLRNPWGIDGYTSTDGANDGYVTVTAEQASKAMLGLTIGTFA